MDVPAATVIVRNVPSMLYARTVAGFSDSIISNPFLALTVIPSDAISVPMIPVVS